MKISSDIIRIYKTLHTWVGVICGLFLFIAFFAGALTVFEEPISQWATPPIHENNRLVPLETMSAFVAELVETDSAAAKHFYLYLDPLAQHKHQIIWPVRDEQADELDNSANRFYSAGTDQDGQLFIKEV